MAGRVNSQTRTIDGRRFLLKDEIASHDGYLMAQVTAAMYRGLGQLCRVEVVEPMEGKHTGFYRIWVGPKRDRKPRTFGENLKAGFMKFKRSWAKWAA